MSGYWHKQLTALNFRLYAQNDSTSKLYNTPKALSEQFVTRKDRATATLVQKSGGTQITHTSILLAFHPIVSTLITH
jgi:hypothetical protein